MKIFYKKIAIIYIVLCLLNIAMMVFVDKTSSQYILNVMMGAYCLYRAYYVWNKKGEEA